MTRSARCVLCGKTSPRVAASLGVCLVCIRERSEQALAVAENAHAATRRAFGLPEAPPRAAEGVRCGLCTCDCAIGEGQTGYCGLREVRSGKLRHLAGTPDRGLLHWYRDPLPTNCVADWVCSGSAQRGKHNLAVFYAACTFNCLFCQNWHYRDVDPRQSRTMSAQELADVANERTYCVCYFGGDPATQMAHALASAHLLAERGVVVCWETNGSAHPKLMDRAVELSLQTGGCVKFDLKAWNPALNRALTGVDNAWTLENFARAAARFAERPDPPLVVASTLLVPGYVDAEEVGNIARFIAGIDPRIPYALLAFAPQFYFHDLGYTSRRQAEEAEAAARAAGLLRVRLGNRHLIGLGDWE
ncbi:MAG: radical SAM protein [Anaerolineae bacterium]|nr:radical SAM protein [Anaerolineae bacterium]